MSDKELKLAIKNAVIDFSKEALHVAAAGLFETLGYNTDRRNPFTQKTFEYFKDAFLGSCDKFSEEKACVKDWKSIDLLFQLTADEISSQHSLFDTKQVDDTIIETYLFFSIELARPEYNRTQLAQITREINKVFPMPVLIVFKHGENITLSVISRRLNRRDARKDVLEKVTVIKDISVTTPHRAHIEILFDLSFLQLQRIHKVANFVELHNAWQKTLDTKELNKRFYRDLSNWYFWALQEVHFPTTNWAADKNSLLKEEEKVKEHNAKNLIRLLTRLLFVWFVKEKNLVPNELFDESYIKDNLLNGFEPRKKKGFDHKTQGSKYYRAILQNLFFATLNQTVGKREFRKDGQQMNVTNLMRYESYFKDPKTFINLVEDIVPFMNGGLFECLDSPDPVLKGKKGGDVIIYEDGFSDRKDNTLFVPDYIFFGTAEQADLSVELGDKKQKDVTVNGLINILKSYKFTVTENTPIEEDIALDPELLGRVFENLLASYNPETKTTARKQTGSFYTPREIVNYMVDESLKAYLKEILVSKAGMHAEEAEAGLDLLLGYNEREHVFGPEQTAALIVAIDNCKILDPACGSGAFPMGILHKLVHVLHKLDPGNELWRQIQADKAVEETKEAFQIGDKQERGNRLREINEIFENNSDDYGRKLFLIENCIYGVDIQPIAAQISKLRFFISLIVDQKTDRNKENFGVRPLPNLETKFIAANTLIGIEKPDGLLRDIELDKLEQQLKDVRHRLFSAKTPLTKRKLREEDQRIREEMGRTLGDAGWSNESARQLAAWDPYNQNVSSGWFDPEWMFGIENGFDVVIGNPPYLESRHPSFSDALKQDYQKHCSLRWGEDSDYITKGSDLLVYFFETSIKLISNNGSIVLITQNAWLDTEYGIKLQHFLTKHTSVKFIIDSKYRYFPAGEGPNINTVITVFIGKDPCFYNNINFVLLKENIQEITLPHITEQYYSDQVVKINSFDKSDPLLSKYKWGILHNTDAFLLELLGILEQRAVPLHKIGNSSKYQYGQGLNLAKSFFIPQETIKSIGITDNAKIPILYSGSPFQLDNSDWFLVDKNLTDKNLIKELKKLGYDAFDTNSTRKLPPVLIMPRGISKHFCSKNNISAYSLSGVDVYCNDNILDKTEINRLWLFFNSSIFWLLREISGRKNLGGGLLKSEAADLKNFPVYIELDIPKEILTLKREAIDSISEIKTTEHKMIDDIVCKSLKLTQSQQEKCQEYLMQMIEVRSSKSIT